MKIGRNDPCPCGSGKKYKRCCMDNVSKQHAQLIDDLEQTVAMNPDLTPDAFNVLAQNRIEQYNNRPIAEFCGLSPSQMGNWMSAPFNALSGVKINTP